MTDYLLAAVLLVLLALYAETPTARAALKELRRRLRH